MEEKNREPVEKGKSLGETLEGQLALKGMKNRVFWREEVDSTNTWAKDYASRRGGKSLDRALFMAECQSAGRGRFQRVWDSRAGENLYMSLVLWEPEIPIQSASMLTLVMGLSAAKAATRITRKKAGIKWPNDVVLSGKKICGILTEMNIKENKPQYIIIGAGVNVNQREFSEEIRDKAGSLALEAGNDFDRAQVAAEILSCFEKAYKDFLKTQDLSVLKAEYEEFLLNKDQPARIIEKGVESRGIARGITDQGELLVEDQEGKIRKIFSGEVSVRGLYSYV